MTTPRKTDVRGGNPANVVTVQDAAHDTIHNVAGVVPKQLAEAANIRYRDLLDIGNPFSGRKLRAEEIAPIVNATFLVSGIRCYLIPDVIERQIGRVGFVLPVQTASADADLIARTGQVTKEFGDLLERLPLALDGHVTQADADAIRKEWRELVAVAAELMAAIDIRVQPALGIRSVSR